MNDYKIKQITNPELKSSICKNILEALPKWFSIPRANEEYIKKTAELPFFAVYTGDERTIGFVALRIRYEKSAEFYVLGLLKEYHNQGIGTKLLKEAENYLKQEGISFLQVKTISEISPDKFYAKTRLFYKKFGFVELETNKRIWDEENPCLIMIKHI